MLEKFAIFGNVQPHLQPHLVAADSHRRAMLNDRCRQLLFVWWFWKLGPEVLKRKVPHREPSNLGSLRQTGHLSLEGETQPELDLPIRFRQNPTTGQVHSDALKEGKVYFHSKVAGAAAGKV